MILYYLGRRLSTRDATKNDGRIDEPCYHYYACIIRLMLAARNCTKFCAFLPCGRVREMLFGINILPADVRGVSRSDSRLIIYRSAKLYPLHPRMDASDCHRRRRWHCSVRPTYIYKILNTTRGARGQLRRAWEKISVNPLPPGNDCWRGCDIIIIYYRHHVYTRRFERRHWGRTGRKKIIR